jgi:hypothetical protein
MTRIPLVALALATTLLTSAPVRAQDTWVLIGAKAIQTDERGGRDAIDTTAAKGSFKAVRLVAKENDIQLTNVEVTYAGAAAHNERREINLNANDRTRPIDPSDSGRFVDRVTLSFKPTSDKVATRVEVWGLQSAALARAARSAPVTAPQPAPATASPTPAPTQAPAPAPVAAAPAPAPSAGARADLKPGETNAQGDVLFGTQTVGFGVDRDVIRVGAEIGRFDRVRMRVLDNDIFLRTARVVYTDGDSQDVTIDALIKQNTRTRWIPVKREKFIKEFQLVYNSKPSFRGRAFIEVYGHYAEGWLGPQGDGRKFNSGFVLLGAQSAGFSIDRNDRIDVGANEGGFRRVRINVRDEAITLFEVRVVYGNGEVDIIPANRTRIDAGGAFGPIDLKGGARVIREIRPTYRTRIFQQGGVARGRAVVEFWGQH